MDRQVHFIYTPIHSNWITSSVLRLHISPCPPASPQLDYFETNLRHDILSINISVDF